MDTDHASTLHLDARGLRVLAHPLRSRLLARLRMDGPATATTLAASLGTNSGATSYHLRRLAAVGLVEEAEGGRGRERVWRASSASHGWTAQDVAGNPDGQAASDWLKRFYLRWIVDANEAWLTAQADWPVAWREAADASDFQVRVTPSQLVALGAELAEVIGRYRDLSPDDDAAEEVVVSIQAVPLAVARRAMR